MNDTMKAVDLFAGAGGMSAGAEQAGLEVVAAYDNWQPAIDTYNANFGHRSFCTDLSSVGDAVANIANQNPDFIIGGPPCQDFSEAGRRTEGSRAMLTGSFVEIIRRLGPLGFVMENVPSASKSAAYRSARSDLQQAGYGLTEIYVDASYYGVPQRRKRFIVVGVLGMPNDLFRPSLLEAQSIFPLTVRRGVDQIQLDHYYRHPRSYTRRAVFSVDEPSPTIRGTNRPRPTHYNPHPGDSSKRHSIRALSAEERSLIQTFDQTFIWKGSRTEIEQMIGNAVPVELARRVLQQVCSVLDSGGKASVSSERWEESISTRSTALVRRFEKHHPLYVGESELDYVARMLESDATGEMSKATQEGFEKLLEQLSHWTTRSA